jgi:hypothetical protein
MAMCSGYNSTHPALRTPVNLFTFTSGIAVEPMSQVTTRRHYPWYVPSCDHGSQIYGEGGGIGILEHVAHVQGVDGVILVHNPSKQTHEQELEQVYKSFVQPLKLTKQQCAIISMNLSGSVGISSSLTGRLAALKQYRVDVNLANAHQAHEQAVDAVDQLVAQCVAKQLLRAEEDVMAAN